MRKIRTKLLAVMVLVVGLTVFSLRPDQFTTSAESDPVVTQITKYKTWTRLNKKPIGVDFGSLLKKAPDTGLDNGGFTIDGGGGWTFLIDGEEVSRSGKHDDLFSIISGAGRSVWKVFSRKEKEPIAPPQPDVRSSAVKAESDITNHGQTFGVVYANDLALAEAKNERPEFPVGSIFVREKNVLENSPVPQTVIAMVKREKGFSTTTNDWEFFLFDGYLMNLKVRETVGSCSACHAAAAKTDWVFLKEINKE